MIEDLERFDRLDSTWLGELLARCHFPAANSIADLAVSGGPDSMAMMLLAKAHGLDATVHHVDHRIRRDSRRDRDVVKRLSGTLGYELKVYELPISPGADVEQRARISRRSALPSGCLTGHTAEDQAETLLLALGRGAGVWGLAGMAPQTGHPLLGLRRAETHRIVADAGIEIVEDSTNNDRRFRRNRVRHDVVPALDEAFERDVVPVLVRTASTMRELAEWVDDLSRDLDPSDARAVANAPKPVAVAALRSWWRRETGMEQIPDNAATDRLLAVASGAVARHDVVGGWYVRRTGGRLYLTAYGAATSDPETKEAGRPDTREGD